MQGLNRDLLDRSARTIRFEGVIQSYELAFRMQTAVPERCDLTSRAREGREMYGLDAKETRGVRDAVPAGETHGREGCALYRTGGTAAGTHHNNLRKRLADSAAAIDKPIAALVADLKRRDMLDETLIVWGGEFGRSSYEQNDKSDGRRHNNRGYTMWMAGGGIKGGMRFGRCDEHGVAVEDRVHLHDLHATILHQLGLDHTKLTYRYAGRDFRLTDVHGRVVNEIIA